MIQMLMQPTLTPTPKPKPTCPILPEGPMETWHLRQKRPTLHSANAYCPKGKNCDKLHPKMGVDIVSRFHCSMGTFMIPLSYKHCQGETYLSTWIIPYSTILRFLVFILCKLKYFVTRLMTKEKLKIGKGG